MPWSQALLAPKSSKSLGGWAGDQSHRCLVNFFLFCWQLQKLLLLIAVMPKACDALFVFTILCTINVCKCYMLHFISQRRLSVDDTEFSNLAHHACHFCAGHCFLARLRLLDLRRAPLRAVFDAERSLGTRGRKHSPQVAMAIACILLYNFLMRQNHGWIWVANVTVRYTSCASLESRFVRNRFSKADFLPQWSWLPWLQLPFWTDKRLAFYNGAIEFKGIEPKSNLMQ